MILNFAASFTFQSYGGRIFARASFRGGDWEWSDRAGRYTIDMEVGVTYSGSITGGRYVIKIFRTVVDLQGVVISEFKQDFLSSIFSDDTF